MPASTIDMFFACTLIVSVAIIATAFLAGTMHTQIGSIGGLNQESYLQGIADRIVSSYGSPTNWGASQNIPNSLGLSSATSGTLYELDIDKICRINNQNSYSLSYSEALAAAHISNIAFGVDVSQMLTIGITRTGNTTIGNIVTYTFQISISQDSGPIQSTLKCYFLAASYSASVSNVTSSFGIGTINVNVPTSAAGPAVFLVFAQANLDFRLCAYEVYPFAHLSSEPSPNGTYLNLSPLNSTLTVEKNFPASTINNAYAFSYSYNSTLNPISGSTYTIPDFVDKSPVVIVVKGTNGTASFNEWVAYPQAPSVFGGNFSSISAHVFVYVAIIDEVLYKVTLRFGDATN